MTTEATVRIRYQVAIPLCHVAKIATIIQKHHECEIFNSLIHCIYRSFPYIWSKSHNVMAQFFINHPILSLITGGLFSLIGILPIIALMIDIWGEPGKRRNH
jgi:hypothetical protein